MALDAVGRRLAERTVPATSEGHLALVAWAAQWPQVRFALEDCRLLTRRLEQDLFAAAAGSRERSIRSTPKPSRWLPCATRT